MSEKDNNFIWIEKRTSKRRKHTTGIEKRRVKGEIWLKKTEKKDNPIQQDLQLQDMFKSYKDLKWKILNR